MPHLYLNAFLSSQPKKGRGLRSKWACAASCQSAFISHVLSGKYELSLEQAEAISRCIGHSKEEKEFFLLLTERARASTPSLKNYFHQAIQEKILARENLRTRMKIKENLKTEDQAIYYSRWHYSAIHMILTIPRYQTIDSIAEYFHLSHEIVREVLDFLETRNFVESQNGKYKVKGPFLHISKDSPLYFQQQVFWRHKAIESIYKNSSEEIHFASCFSISEKDIKKIQDILRQTIESSSEIIKPSKEEKLYSLCLDLFEVR